MTADYIAQSALFGAGLIILSLLALVILVLAGIGFSTVRNWWRS